MKQVNPTSDPRLLSCLLLFLCSIFLCSNSSSAQIPPDKDGLIKAEGMGQAKYAEMNGYPGPKHVLDLGDKLKLSETQRKSVQKFYDEMSMRAKELGKQIIQIEQELNDAYANGLISEKAAQNDCEEIGRLRGKLRAVHLAAHMKTKVVLNEMQIALYRKLRSEGGEQKH